MSDWPKHLRRSKLLRWVGLPLLAVAVYLSVIAQDRFVSESKVIVKQSGHANGVDLSLGSLLGGGSNALREDAMLLREHILSPDMLLKVDEQLGLRAAFSEAGSDLLVRLAPDASREDMLAYYRQRVSAHFDDQTGMLVLRSEGFTAAFAQRLNKAILGESERFINELSHRISRDEMAFARQEMTRAHSEVSAAREALLDYQNKNGMLDPMARADAASRMLAEMETKQAMAETELRTLQSYLNDDTPQVVAAKQALAAMKAQITAEKAKLSAPEDGRLNRKAAEFAELKAKLDFANDLYKVTLASYEKARVDAGRKIKSLAVIAAPNLPQDAEYPRRIYSWLSVALGLLLAYGVIRLVWSVVEDHQT